MPLCMWDLAKNQIATGPESRHMSEILGLLGQNQWHLCFTCFLQRRFVDMIRVGPAPDSEAELALAEKYGLEFPLKEVVIGRLGRFFKLLNGQGWHGPSGVITRAHAAKLHVLLE